MASSSPKSSTAVKKTVNLLRNLGFMALPIPPGTKQTDEEKFTDPAFVTDWDRWEKQDLGVGIILSTRYKLVDIDLDEPGISDLAKNLLPKKGWIFGRNGKKSSHHMFLVANVADTTQLERALDPKNKGYMDTEKINHIRLNSEPPTEPKSTIIEFRGDRGQTVMPGTIHPSGELIKWENGEPKDLPAPVETVELRVAVRKIAFAVMVAKHGWFDGSRHELSLALSGMMASAKWTKDEAVHWWNCFLTHIGDGSDKTKVIQACRDTYKAVEAKKNVAAGPRYAEITGCPELVAAFRKMFMDQREAIFEDMNDKYALGVYFSKVCVFDMSVIDDLTVPDFETLSVQDFHLFGSNQRVKVPGPKGDRFITKSKFWIENSKRRSFRTTDFMPGEPSQVGDKFNLWRGWAVKPSSAGDISNWRGHVSDFICGGDAGLEEWLFAWLADIVQKPMGKPGTALMMRSGTRTGKNTFVEMMKRVIGIRYVREMNASGQITNRFNSHFQYALLVFANEADFASSNAATNVLKTLITDKDFHMEHKNAHAKTGRNFSRVVLASNKLHVINRDIDDQRFTVADVVNPLNVLGEDEKTKHFNRVYHEIENGGPARLLHELMHHKYDPEMLRSCYQSEAGRRQTLLSMNVVAQWWSSCVSNAKVPVPDDYYDRVEYADGSMWPVTIGKAALEASFRMTHKGNEKVASAAFHAMFYEGSGIPKTNTKQIGGRHSRYRALLIPERHKCLEMMNEQFSGAIAEDDPITDDHFDTPLERTDEMDEY